MLLYDSATHTALAGCHRHSTVLANKDSYVPQLKMDQTVNAVSLKMELVDKACPPKTVFYIPTYTYQVRDSCAYSCRYSCEHVVNTALVNTTLVNTFANTLVNTLVNTTLVNALVITRLNT